MKLAIESCVRRGRGVLKKWAAEPHRQRAARAAGYFLCGCLFSAASLCNAPMPLTLGLMCALSGWRALLVCLGGVLGYPLFWGGAGAQGTVWLLAALPVRLLPGKHRLEDQSPLLMSAIGGLIVSAVGLAFQVFLRDTTSVPVYLLRVALGAGAVRLFELAVSRRDPVAEWVALGAAVLALVQVPPALLSPGYLLAGALAASGSFPAAALAGLALDLADVIPVPMTAAMCLAYLVRLLPARQRWLRYASPGIVYLLVMSACGERELAPFLPLALGGAASLLLPQRQEAGRYRGETGMAQVRLELVSGCLSQAQQLMTETELPPVDEEALLARTRERACGACPCRKTCQDRLSPLPRALLHEGISRTGALPVACRKPGRLVLELHRAQEQLRSIHADRERQGEYRAAVAQQYQFLANYLQQLADQLPRHSRRQKVQFRPEVAVCSAGREIANGDRCISFSGTHARFYVLLCDGMGTGLGAAEAGQRTAEVLQDLLRAGFPAEYALRSVNSFLALQGRAGAVTVDLAELCLDTGRAAVYKWGAAPSYLLHEHAAEKIGTAGSPPGLSVTEDRETVERLSLRRGEVLILVSDGVDGEGALRRLSRISPPGELAAKILEYGARGSEDDATVAAVCLFPGAVST